MVFAFCITSTFQRMCWVLVCVKDVGSSYHIINKYTIKKYPGTMLQYVVKSVHILFQMAHSRAVFDLLSKLQKIY